MKIKISIKKPRNPLYGNPLLRKGGVHEKSKQTKRRIEKQKLKNEWRSLMIFLRVLLKNSILKRIRDCSLIGRMSIVDQKGERSRLFNPVMFRIGNKLDKVASSSS